MKHSAAFEALVNKYRGKVRETTVADIAARQKAGERFHLVDVREDDEWRAGRLPQAIHIGKGVIERDIEKAIPELATEIVLYCGGGFRSALAGESLKKMGYTNVASMAGGWREWKEKSYPTE